MSDTISNYYVLSKFSKQVFVILTYHRVNNESNDWSVRPLKVESFENHLKFLNNKYNIISLNDLATLMINRKPIPKKTAIITFDDGYKDNYTNAYPLLKKYDIPATIFLITNCIGTGDLLWDQKVGFIVQNSSLKEIHINGLGEYSLNSKFKTETVSNIKQKLKKLNEIEKNNIIKELADACEVEIPQQLGSELMLSWDEVYEMSENGIDFGAHTLNHPILTNLKIKEAKKEISESKNLIEKKLGKEITSFSYPYGIFNKNIVDMVRECGFNCSVTLNQELGNYNNDLHALSRIDTFENFYFFRLFLAGYGKHFYHLVKLKNQIVQNKFYLTLMSRINL